MDKIVELIRAWALARNYELDKDGDVIIGDHGDYLDVGDLASFLAAEGIEAP